MKEHATPEALPTSEPGWVEYPDPVIVSFIARIEGLHPIAVRELNPPFWSRVGIGIVSIQLRDVFRILWLGLFTVFMSWTYRRITRRSCTDPVAREAYRQLWQQTKKGRWNSLADC